MKLRCCCKQCRPANQTLKQAIKALHWDAQVQRYGLKEAQRRKRAGIDRLRELNRR